MSSKTIQRYLKSIGWKKLVPLSKPYLTEKMMKQRVDWCKKHRGIDWKNVVFSDESIASLKSNGAKIGEEFVSQKIHLRLWYEAG